MKSKAFKMRNHIVFDTVIFAVHGLIPHSFKNLFKAHRISCLNASFSRSIQTTAKLVFAPAFVNAYLNTARLMTVIELVCLNMSNGLWFILSLISLWSWQTNFRGKLKHFVALSAARNHSRKCRLLLFLSPRGKPHVHTFSPRATWSKSLKNLRRSAAEFHCHTWACSTCST